MIRGAATAHASLLVAAEDTPVLDRVLELLSGRDGEEALKKANKKVAGGGGEDDPAFGEEQEQEQEQEEEQEQEQEQQQQKEQEQEVEEADEFKKEKYVRDSEGFKRYAHAAIRCSAQTTGWQEIANHAPADCSPIFSLYFTLAFAPHAGAAGASPTSRRPQATRCTASGRRPSSASTRRSTGR